MDAQQLIDLAAKKPRGSVARSLLVAAAVQTAIGADVVVVGGTAVNRYTDQYRPTDIDLVASVDSHQRDLMVAAGFKWLGTGHRHLSIAFWDGEEVLVEFPSERLDGRKAPEIIEVADGVRIRVISLDDLVIDRLVQATDGTLITTENAVDLLLATYDRVDWDFVEEQVARRAGELPELEASYQRVRDQARRILRAEASDR